MRVSLNLSSLSSRIATVVISLGLGFCLAGAALTRFVTATVVDPRFLITQPMLEEAAGYFPDHAPIHARLASRLVEINLDATQDHESVAAKAASHAARAVKLAPRNYEYRILLSAAKELQGDLPAAEQELREALKLAPNNVGVHWQLANLLLREGKPDQSVSEFRAVAAADAERIPAILGLLWQTSGGKTEMMSAGVGDSPKSSIALAQFLVDHKEFEAAAKIFTKIDRKTRLESPESGKFLNLLLAADQPRLAGKLWRELFEVDGRTEQSLIWNGGFENPIRKGLAHFDWNLASNKYASLGITTGNARTGERALRLTYLGIETTRLESEVQQLILVRPGARYRLECFAKVEALATLATPNGPQLAVVRPDSRVLVAASAIVNAGSREWQALSLDFTAPADVQMLIVTIKQTPQFSYVEPTRGTVWFDDFKIQEQ